MRTLNLPRAALRMLCHMREGAWHITDDHLELRLGA
jgi:hypothetical protein